MSKLTASEATLFADAVAQPPELRGAFLKRVCGQDTALYARMLALVSAHEATAMLPAPPPPELSGEEKPGEVIGRYKLLQKLGEGGCGVVWMAEQEHPVRRRVALKIIKLGMDTKTFVARFDAERQALARMDHPNIAQVHDAGSTGTGRPFFVMELVRGIPITKYCDENHLGLLARLELFMQVCQAAHHAHQKGVIHRDLKPSNILVTVNDGTAMPKLIDFGIAKATEGRLTDATILTTIDQFIGTPAYMSPEQADLSGLDIDRRSDIYSLGVLLYELLAGRPPFDPKVFTNASIAEIRHRIREDEPPKPSTRVTTLPVAERATIAKLRETAPAELSVFLRGDIDWIVMRCLEKDRTRRYDTAQDLQADIERHLRNEPITARPPSARYLLQKFARRNRVPLLAVGAAAAALVLGLSLRPVFWKLDALAAAVRPLSDRSVAVLPFANLSPNPGDAFFADGIHEDVITSLAKIHELKVISRSSVLAYRDPTTRNLRKIAGELGVSAVLEGSVRRMGDGVRVAMQLIDPSTNQHLWADTYSMPLTEIFSVQTSLAERVASALKVNLTGGERTLIARHPTRNPEAYDLYTRARTIQVALGLAGTREQYEQVVLLYEQAIARDPDFSLAYVQLSITHGFLYFLGWLDPTAARLQRVKETAEAAVRIAPNSPEARMALGAYLLQSLDPLRALAEFHVAETGLPNDAQLLFWIGATFREVGRLAEALPYFERASMLNPNDVATVQLHIQTLILLRRFAPARDIAIRSAARFPHYRRLGELQAKASFALDGDRAATLRLLGALPPGETEEDKLLTAYFSALRRGDLAEAEQLLANTKLSGIPDEGELIIAPIAFHRAFLAFLRGDHAAARAAADEAIVELRRQTWTARQAPWGQIRVAWAEALGGRGDDAVRRVQETYARLGSTDSLDAVWMRHEIAFVHLVLGRQEEALQLLRQMMAGPCWLSPNEIRNDPLWAPLSSDPRFEEILGSAKPL